MQTKHCGQPSITPFFPSIMKGTEILCVVSSWSLILHVKFLLNKCCVSKVAAFPPYQEKLWSHDILDRYNSAALQQCMWVTHLNKAGSLLEMSFRWLRGALGTVMLGVLQGCICWSLWSGCCCCRCWLWRAAGTLCQPSGTSAASICAIYA